MFKKMREKKANKLAKKRNKIEGKIIKEVSKKLQENEEIVGLVAHSNDGQYVVRTTKDRLFVKGVRNFSIIETIVPLEKVAIVTKDGMHVILELFNNSKISIATDSRLDRIEKVYNEIQNLLE